MLDMQSLFAKSESETEMDMYSGKIEGGSLSHPDFVKEEALDRKTIFDKLIYELQTEQTSLNSFFATAGGDLAKSEDAEEVGIVESGLNEVFSPSFTLQKLKEEMAMLDESRF
jgi:hypothetical protein